MDDIGGSMRGSMLLVYVLLGLANLLFGGFEVMTRYLLVGGLSSFIFAVYRNVLAFFTLFVASYVLERHRRPQLTTKIVGQFFVLGFIGMLVNQIAYYWGLQYTSAPYTSAMLNSTPAFTFILSVICRLEKVRLKRKDGIAKICGTAIGIAGALVMICYKGPHLLYAQSTSSSSTTPTENNFQIGSICLIFACLSFAIYLILQKQLSDTYPAPISIAAGATFFGSIDLAIAALIVERRPSAWILHDWKQYTGALYAGVVASGVVTAIQSWVVKIQRGGPMKVAAFQPFETLTVAVLSILFLKEPIYYGSLIGGVVVTIGLYLYIWGQYQDTIFTQMKEDALTHSLLQKGDGLATQDDDDEVALNITDENREDGQ